MLSWKPRLPLLPPTGSGQSFPSGRLHCDEASIARCNWPAKQEASLAQNGYNEHPFDRFPLAGAALLPGPDCSSLEEAGKIGRQLVAKRLAACVNLVPGVRSWYWWEDKVVEDDEVMVMIKTSRERLADLEKEVVRLHSCAVPEVIALQVVDGSQNYLNWIEFSLSGKP